MSEYGRVGDLGEEELTTSRKKGARGRGEGAADDGRERWEEAPHPQLKERGKKKRENNAVGGQGNYIRESN